MLCLCTTLGQDGLTARLFVVRCEVRPELEVLMGS
jgi:hypothetical protein